MHFKMRGGEAKNVQFGMRRRGSLEIDLMNLNGFLFPGFFLPLPKNTSFTDFLDVTFLAHFLVC